MIEISDELYEGVLLGDVKSANEFYGIIAKAMLPEARQNFGHDKNLMDEVIQIAIIKLHDKLPTIDVEKVIGYARLTIFTTCMDVHRNNAKGVINLNFDVETDGLVGVSYDIEDPLVIDDFKSYDPDVVMEKIDEAISKLPPKYKSVFTMFHLDNMTHAEIFEAIGGSTKANLARAKGKLRKDLGSYEEVLLN